MTTDHRNENLRRKSFATQSLQAVSFDGADLRGADFTMADLSNACLLYTYPSPRDRS